MPFEPMTPWVVVQVKVGWAVKASPNWSRPVAANCCVAPVRTTTGVGLTRMPVNV